MNQNKNKTVMSAVALTVIMAAVCSIAQIKYERPYDFRKRLEIVHEPDQRDTSLQPATDEFEFKDGVTITLAKEASPFLFRAAQDFQDFLAVSMGVSAIISRTNSAPAANTLSLVVDGKGKTKSYRVTVGGGIQIAAADERGAAQALYHLEDLMNLRQAPFLKRGSKERAPLFSPRMTHSGWGLDRFPDAYLKKMAHYGLDAILVFVKDIDVTKAAGYQDIRALIRRAAEHGLDTYLYSYIKAFVHPDDPGAKEVFEKTYGRIAAAYPGAKGIIFVGESCRFPSKDERTARLTPEGKVVPGDKRPHPGWYPCKDYPDWVNAVKAALDKHQPGIEIVFWSYNWGRQAVGPRLELINNLPKDVTLMATFEMFENHVKRNGLKSYTADYSLTFVGPGEYFSSEAAEAHKLGLKLYTMSNTGGRTWDFGTAPYEPFPYQWKRRWDALRKAHDDWGLSGLMENHHYGWQPSFISELAKEAFWENGMDFDTHIRLIAARDFGEENVEAVLAVWKEWSEAIRDMHATAQNQYGPFRIGSAYPFNLLGPTIAREEFPTPVKSADGSDYVKLNFNTDRTPKAVLEQELELLRPMAESWFKGGKTFAGLASSLSGVRAKKAQLMANLGEYFGRVTYTAIHLKEGALAEKKSDREEILRVARKEHANAKAALELVKRDSRLGWEPSMDYLGGAEQIEWKLKRMETLYNFDK
ncbi:MAG: hypothetical protein WC340_06485 [Kiritimatiellia bacterium]